MVSASDHPFLDSGRYIMRGHKCKVSCTSMCNFKICFDSCTWIALCLIYISRLLLVLVFRERQGLNLSIGSTEQAFYEDGDSSVSEKLLYKI